MGTLGPCAPGFGNWPLTLVRTLGETFIPTVPQSSGQPCQVGVETEQRLPLAVQPAQWPSFEC